MLTRDAIGEYYSPNDVALRSSAPTIYEVLRDKLQREPTHNELNEECTRIIHGTKPGSSADALPVVVVPPAKRMPKTKPNVANEQWADAGEMGTKDDPAFGPL